MIESYFFVYTKDKSIGEIMGEVLSKFINHPVKITDILINEHLDAKSFLENNPTNEDIIVYMGNNVKLEKLEGLPINYDKLIFEEY